MKNLKIRAIAPVFRKYKLFEAPKEAVYWRTRPYSERLAALEEIRQEYHRWKHHAEPGFQRVYSIDKR
jgi:hypothetical protein